MKKRKRIAHRQANKVKPLGSVSIEFGEHQRQVVDSQVAVKSQTDSVDVTDYSTPEGDEGLSVLSTIESEECARISTEQELPASSGNLSDRLDMSVNEKDTAELKAMVDVYHQVAVNSRSELREFIISNDELKKRLTELESENAVLRNSSATQESSLQMRFQELGVLASRLVELENSIQERDNRLTQYDQHADALEHLGSSLHKLVGVIEEEKLGRSAFSGAADEKIRKNLFPQFESIQKEIDSIQIVLKKSNSEIREWKEKFEGLENEYSSLIEKNAATSREREYLEKMCNDLQHQCDERKIALDEVRRNMAHQTKIIRDETKARIAAEQKIVKMKRSLSWRVTRPIRMIASLQKSDSTSAYISEPSGKIMSLVRESGFFDAEWYSKMYPEVGGGKLNPLEYFCTHGLSKNHDPGPNFSSAGYAEKYPDVAQAGTPSFLHYLLHGKAEGRCA